MQTWLTSSLITYTYNANNQIILELEKTWSANEWKNVSRITYTYDSNNE